MEGYNIDMVNFKKVSHKGRIISVLVFGCTIFAIREVVKSHFGEVPHMLPVPALIPLIIVWYLGYQYDKSVDLSTRDTLTKIFNRRYVLNRFPKESTNCKKRNIHMAVLVLDVNDFKKINDQFGHETGDQVLVGISKLLEETFDPKDIIARWGGDEFLVLSKFEDEHVLSQKIEQLKHGMKQKQWKIQHHNVSVSIGKAIFPTDGQNLNSLIAKADSNMYEIKMQHKKECYKAM